MDRHGDDHVDYYLILSETGHHDPAGILVEEFVLRDDLTAYALDTAGWTSTDGGWWSSAEYSRAIRTVSGSRGLVVSVERSEAADAYRRLGGGDLPLPAAIRTRFTDRLLLPASDPLRLTASDTDTRIYRILLSGEAGPGPLAELAGRWSLAGIDDPANRVLGRAVHTIGTTPVVWELRRIGPGVAWAVDVTMSAAAAGLARGLLRTLTVDARMAGFIPVTIERFA